MGSGATIIQEGYPLRAMLGLAAHIGTMLLALIAPADEKDAAQTVDEPRAAPSSYAPAAPGDLQLEPRVQSRVEGRITIRIRPAQGSSRLMSALPAAPMSRRMRGVPIDRCLPLASVAAVQVTRNNALLLYLKDRRIVLAALEKACRARDFYSGFYVAPQEDGQLCVERDRLQSRVGAKCMVKSWQELVPVED